MYTKQQALNFAKQNNIKVKQFKNDVEQGYLVGNVKIVYCGYGNNYKVENSLIANNLGDILVVEITKQI
jgi:hypothetical protein